MENISWQQQQVASLPQQKQEAGCFYNPTPVFCSFWEPSFQRVDAVSHKKQTNKKFVFA